MKKTIYFLSIFIIAFSECHAQTVEWLSVTSKGETLIRKILDRSTVQIKITTHEVNIGNASDGWPEKPSNSCTYSRYPCSLVDDISISINEKNILIPRSVFSNLSDLNRVRVSKVKQSFLLVIEGGDASESYITKIVFDNRQVRRQTFSSALFPNKISTEIKFNNY